MESTADEVTSTGMIPQLGGSDLDSLVAPHQTPIPSLAPRTPSSAPPMSKPAIPAPPSQDAVRELFDKANNMPASGSPAPSAEATFAPQMGSQIGDLTNMVNTNLVSLLPRMAAARRQQGEAQKQTALSEAQALGQYRDNITKIYQENKPAKVNFDEPPKPVEVDPLENFGSIASMIGIFGSLFTKKPIVSALNASAAAMKAQRDGDYLRYKQAYQTWQDQTDLAMKKHRTETEDLNGIMNLATTDSQTALAQLKAYGVANQSEAASTLAEMGDWKEIGNWVSSMGNMQLRGMEAQTALHNQMAKEQDKLRQDHIYQGTLKALLEENPEATSLEKMQFEQQAYAASKGKGGSTANQYSDEDLRFMAQQYLKGDKSVISGLGYGNVGAQNRMALRTSIREVAEEQGMNASDVASAVAEFEGLKSEQRAIGTRTGAIKVAAEAVEGAAAMALESSDKLDRSKYPNFNSVENAFKIGTGDASIVDFLVKTNTLINEYASAQNPRGVPRIEDKNQAREILATNYNKGQYETGVKAILQEVHNIKKATKTVKHIGRSTEADTPEKPKVTLPEAARTKLKKGVHTKFGNGQVWSLDDSDEPVQIQ